MLKPKLSGNYSYNLQITFEYLLLKKYNIAPTYFGGNIQEQDLIAKLEGVGARSQYGSGSTAHLL